MPTGDFSAGRRQILSAIALASGLLAAPMAAAQPAARPRRIGVLGNEDNPPWEGLRSGLRELGYVEGRNVTIEWSWSDGFPERLPALARELVARQPDVIVASGTQAVRAAKLATSTIPIVMSISSYPDRIGLVDSLARPGANVTGLSSVAPELFAKKLELLKEVVRDASPVALVWNPDSPVERLGFGDVSAAASSAGLALRSVELRTPDDFPTAFAALATSGAHSLLVIGNPVTFKARHSIAEFALRVRLPSVFEERLFAEAGGLMSYGPSFFEMFRSTALYVDRILKGTRPADLPVEQPAKFELVINRRTARNLGVTIPPSLLLRAERVID